MSNRIEYKCKKCGWEESIVADWADLKPKLCGNKRCNHSFLKNPTDLETKSPEANKHLYSALALANTFEADVETDN